MASTANGIAAEEVPGSEAVFKSPRERLNSENDVGYRQRGDTFKYVYCDYDISQMPSTVQATDMSDATSDRSGFDVKVVQDERWYDRSSGAYFTSEATRNAQTVSFKQRHRPIFQMYVDLMTCMTIGAVMMISAIMKIRDLNITS